MKHLTYAGALIILMILTCIDLAWGQPYKNLIEITPQFTLKSFIWGEYNDDSKQLLEEKGLQYGGGVTSKIKFSKSLDLFTRFDFNYYAGLVDYDGFLMLEGGGTEPYKSKTGYEGLETLINFGYDFYAGDQFIIAPELGFQYEYWNRDIDNGGKYGYDEVYNLLFIDFGTSLIYQFSRSSKIFFSVMGEFPLLITESVDLASRGQGGPADINLEPEPNIGLNMELGATTYGAFLSFYLDYLLFSKSAFDQGFHQPESDRSVIGMKLGYTFSIN